jgi:putative methionine-R-sulfoxide reductase with GAF domain
MNELIRRIAHTVDSESPREQRAGVAAEIVRSARNYRWVGIYDVGDEELVLIGHAGSLPSADSRFGVDRGLSGDAVRTRRTIVTGSEAIVPILGAESGIAIGTLDAESDRIDAFTRDDVEFLEECASVLRPLYD